MANIQEDRHIVKQVLQYHITTSGTINQEIGMFAACLVSAPTMGRCLQQRGLSARRPLLWFFLTIKGRERNYDLAALNDKAGYRNDPMSSFQTNPGSACRILIVVCMSGGFRRDCMSPACIRYSHKDPTLDVMASTASGYATRISLVFRSTVISTQISTSLTYYVQ